MTRSVLPLFALCLFLSPAIVRGADHPASPRGQAATDIGGKWVEVDYGRPILRGRANIFGTGADYGKTVNAKAPVWRAGANQTTSLTTQLPLKVGDKTIVPGTYDLFVDLKEGAWTLIVSTQPASDKYPTNGKKIWGSYGYDSKFDVVRIPMTTTTSPVSTDEFTIGFVDVTPTALKLQLAWDHTVATASFDVAK